MRGARSDATLERTIERSGAIRRGERIALACSGGVDSVALAAALRALAGPMDLTLRLLHVNHALRDSAWQDECVVLRVAVALDLECSVVPLTAPPRDEAGLREARYAALIAAATSFGAGCIATAHHAQDQSETVLLALFRGAGPDGLSGMRPRRRLADGLDLARPLLRVAADDLERYVQVRGLPYAVDPSNRDRELRRNAVRQALAALRPLFPGLDEAVARAAELTGDEREGTPRAALRRRVRDRLAAEAGLRDLDFAHVESAVRTLERGGSGSFDMTAAVRLRVERGAIAEVERRG